MVKKSKNPLDELKIKPPAKGAFEMLAVREEVVNLWALRTMFLRV